MDKKEMCERVKDGFDFLTDLIIDYGIRHTDDYGIERLLIDLNKDVAYLISYVEHREDSYGNR